MRVAKSELPKKSKKADREFKVLLGLVAYYIEHARPVGSETLRAAEFGDLSGATIRNYFSSLEKEGYLLQHHISGGRIPTDKAYRAYAEAALDELVKEKSHSQGLPLFEPQEAGEMKEVVDYLQKMTESVSELSKCASFLSAPRFDQDFVVDMKLVGFDQGSIVAALLTNFGLIHTEVLRAPEKLSAHSLKRIESYFRSRLMASPLPVADLEKEEAELASRFYQEAMARYLVRYSHFAEDDLYRAGFSKLLLYPEFCDAHSLVSSLSLFENRKALRNLIRESMKSKNGTPKFWIGADLFTHLASEPNAAIIACPYHIGGRTAGAIGILGPMRMPYKEQFSLISDAARAISKCLTSSLMKYKISYRTPSAEALEFVHEKQLLLEDQT
jgi:heat-inducible transcriptional repressor